MTATTKITNLTPHPLNIRGRIIPASGNIARVESRAETVGEIDGIPVVRQTWGDVQCLPVPSDGEIFVVSALVLSRTDRADVFAPADFVRDDSGRVIGCNSLAGN